eukprot:CAMPEP_0173210602 /NCGR_PEP_ID=MMETSP1141-20130122/23761_1 /TAXON_ID=483371 /ORGANISM="non described non described, Strain CCMP2298" /LENGTH=106 /DNA_ID=CAMNT_0014137379 /DNA_START=613 /DNA_END=933 /DNA_ORIENTATION=+
MAGYISLSMPLPLVYLSLISPITWGSYILATLTFRGQTFTCTASEADTQGNCPLSTGEQVLELYGMQGGDGEYGTNHHALMLGGVTLSLFLLTFLVLRLRMLRMSH